MPSPRVWLRAVPGKDPVEQRQAYLLQVVLLAIVAVFILASASNALRNATTGSSLGITANLVGAVLIAGLVVLVRRGYFLIAASLTVALLVAGFASSLAAVGLTAGAAYLGLLMLPIVLAGLILPRLGLLATTVAFLLAGELAMRAQSDAAILTSAGNFLYATVLVAAVVDQFGGTVRGALANAISREHELEMARADLEVRTAELQTAVAALEAEIVERERSETERRAMELRVLEVQKLESLGVLAGGIAHDFNNLLVGIMGNAGLALLEMPPETDGRERIAQIETAARRAADLAREMLAYSGKGRFIVAPIDVSALVREMTHLLDVSIGKSVVLKRLLADRPVVVEADATQLRQVVMNLVVNASDAIGESNGVITVTTGRMRADRDYLAGTFVDEGLAAGEYAFIEVSDTGAGMDQATQARIFDPFFTTKFTGRGLGLAAVLGIVRAHHGALKVYSEPGRGSTFKLLVPTADAPVEPDPWAGRAPTPWRGSGTVLVVDDEPMVREVAKAMLNRLGLTVVQAGDGQEAVDLFSADPGRFDVVLLDLTMPRLSGAEAFRQIRAIRADARVILMSGYNEEEASGRFAGKGLAGFVEKPFSPQDIGTMIRRVLELGDA
jgi:signal transduction histidine kinase